MAVPVLTPASQTSTVILPATGNTDTAASGSLYALGVYVDDTSDLYDINFISGASDQVTYTYRKLGGAILDIELTEKDVYSHYEDAVLEYSYLVNIHQAKNTLPNVLGAPTGTFNQDGEQTSDSPLLGTTASLQYPRFSFGYALRVGDGTSTEANIGGSTPIYSASFDTVPDQQDYDLQSILENQSATEAGSLFYQEVGNKKVTIRKVYYRTPYAMWRFYSYYGGLNTVGNMSTYGQYADDSQFEIVPVWQNKLQAMAYEDAIYTRTSQYSYEIQNNRLKLFPTPESGDPVKYWIEFTVKDDPWTESASAEDGMSGVNNMNTLPFSNLPYNSINSIGKQWIRRFALAISKETLGQVRGKFGTIPIPGNDVTLNASDLLSQAQAEKDALREELKTVLDELTYEKLSEKQNNISTTALETMQKIPVGIFQG
tara:strand:+ start:2582 stop:3868 length:1287 start_codon:yes stop_codon:yes gene_type:complete